ncbi:polyprenyl synthetase family protein [Nocardia vaccinii]|uniref:polyprenyl synthetase family protein n=1 Tax=Nocardia vaccinii TaxID=1822 RepID=UPI000B275A01|nr:polyprenyl synthetase family protein [Nocardia vaccinii]
MTATIEKLHRLHSPATILADHSVNTTEGVARWRAAVRDRVLTELDTFLRRNRIGSVRGIAVDDIARRYVAGGKCLRSTFMYIGWLCGEAPDAAALRAAAALELVHAFAMIQDDVMDESALRRGAPTGQIAFAEAHRARRMPGDPARFGESAAVLLGDICLVWADKMLRDSGIHPDSLERVWPRFDAMRIELAVGQLGDLLNDVRTEPDFGQVLVVARAKSGNYTVRRPLELGAAMAGCDEPLLSALSRYGRVVGEAFQMRDDLLGVFGTADATGKPGDGDLTQHKATTVVIAAQQLAEPAARRELDTLLSAPIVDADATERLRALITASGATDRIEAMIGDRIGEARRIVESAALPEPVRRVLDGMGHICTTQQS